MILKIIGLTLASIIGLAILIFCLVLFVPIRYKVKAKKDNSEELNIEAHGKVTWLLHIFNVHIDYPSEQIVTIRIFFIKLFNKKNKEQKVEKPKKPKKVKKSKEKNIDDNNSISDNSLENSDKTEEVITNNEEISEVVEETTYNEDNTIEVEEDSILSDDDPKLSKFFSKLVNIVLNIKLTVKKVYDKIKNIIHNISHYINIITSETFKKAFHKAKSGLFSIIKKLLPRKLKGNIYYGTGDPGSTAQILGYYSLIYPFIGNSFKIYPDFDNKYIYGDVYLRGHICIFSIIKILAGIYFNKDVKKLLKLLKKEK